MGRRNIEIKRIQNAEARQACFSKRRAGLLKKASRLSILCGEGIAIVVFSPAGKAFAFRHPSVGSIANRFLSATTPYYHTKGGRSQGGDGTTVVVHELNQQHIALQNQLEDEEKKMKMLQGGTERESGGRVMGWLDSKPEELGLEELEEIQKELAPLQLEIKGSIDQLLQNATKHTCMVRRPQQRMFLVPKPQFLLGDEDVKPRNLSLPSSSFGLHKGLDIKPTSNGACGIGTFWSFAK